MLRLPFVPDGIWGAVTPFMIPIALILAALVVLVATDSTSDVEDRRDGE